MSIKDIQSVGSLSVNSVESQEDHEGKSQDSMESEDSFKAPNHKLSLEFRCSDTPYAQRKLCESFWKVIDQHPELDRIMARGWSEKEKASEIKPHKKKTSPPSQCDELQDFLDHNVDKLALLGLRNLNTTCSTKPKSNQSSDTHLLEDLEEFDSRVQTEISIPPKPSLAPNKI